MSTELYLIHTGFLREQEVFERKLRMVSAERKKRVEACRAMEDKLRSLAGGLLSFVVMILLKRTGIFSVIGVCAAAGVAHNLGQLLTAAFLVSNLSIFVYFPVLLFSGIICGIITGFVTTLILYRLPDRIYKFPEG